MEIRLPTKSSSLIFLQCFSPILNAPFAVQIANGIFYKPVSINNAVIWFQIWNGLLVATNFKEPYQQTHWCTNGSRILCGLFNVTERRNLLPNSSFHSAPQSFVPPFCPPNSSAPPPPQSAIRQGKQTLSCLRVSTFQFVWYLSYSPIIFLGFTLA